VAAKFSGLVFDFIASILLQQEAQKYSFSHWVDLGQCPRELNTS
jgi:hypothetical protein